MASWEMWPEDSGEGVDNRNQNLKSALAGGLFSACWGPGFLELSAGLMVGILQLRQRPSPSPVLGVNTLLGTRGSLILSELLPLQHEWETAPPDLIPTPAQSSAVPQLRPEPCDSLTPPAWPASVGAS